MRESVYIADANIIIDLIDLGLGDIWSRHFRCLTSPEVFAEVEFDENDEEANWISNPERLEVRSLEEADVTRALEIQETHPALSYPDCTVVSFAVRTELIVLSGDGPMRKKAPSLRFRLHGMLYILNRLVELEAIHPTDAIAACRNWQELNPRTPDKKCAEYCDRWEKCSSNA